MKRKVTLHGPATLSVSLPLKWARRFDIKKGDELNVLEQKDTLFISSTAKREEKKKIEIIMPPMEGGAILFLLRILYINGYDTIDLKFEKSVTHHSRRKMNITILNLISKEISRLMGLEIIDVKKNSCTLKYLSKESTEEFDISLKRAFTIISIFLKEVKEIIITKNRQEAEELSEDIHNQVTNFLAYDLRTLNKIGYKDRETTLKMYNLIFKLDDFLDHITYWVSEISAYIPIKNKEVLNITDNFNEYFERYIKLFYNFNLETYSEMFEKNYIMRDKITKMEERANINERHYLSHIEKMLEEISKLLVDRMSLGF